MNDTNAPLSRKAAGKDAKARALLVATLVECGFDSPEIEPLSLLELLHSVNEHCLFEADKALYFLSTLLMNVAEREKVSDEYLSLLSQERDNAIKLHTTLAQQFAQQGADAGMILHHLEQIMRHPSFDEVRETLARIGCVHQLRFVLAAGITTRRALRLVANAESGLAKLGFDPNESKLLLEELKRRRPRRTRE